MHIDLISLESLTIFHPVDIGFNQLLVIRYFTLKSGCIALSNHQISRRKVNCCLACSVVIGGM